MKTIIYKQCPDFNTPFERHNFSQDGHYIVPGTNKIFKAMEKFGLDSTTGIGYKGRLENLVQNYAITSHPQMRNDLMNMFATIFSK